MVSSDDIVVLKTFRDNSLRQLVLDPVREKGEIHSGVLRWPLAESPHRGHQSGPVCEVEARIEDSLYGSGVRTMRLGMICYDKTGIILSYSGFALLPDAFVTLVL